MAFRVNNLSLWVDEPTSELAKRAAEKLKVTRGDLVSMRVVRQVLDARKKNSPRYVYTVEVELAPGKEPGRLPFDVSRVDPPPPPARKVARVPEQRPIIIGSGPAGMFCALELLERGVKSVVLERGRDVVQRRKDVARLMRDGTLEPESNMNFGEGGAGAYTDGKLSTRINHPDVRKVIETFARFGAPDRILVQGKPHIGSDLLPFAVERMRQELVAGGCEVRFSTRVDALLYRGDAVCGVQLADG